MIFITDAREIIENTAKSYKNVYKYIAYYIEKCLFYIYIYISSEISINWPRSRSPNKEICALGVMQVRALMLVVCILYQDFLIWAS